MVSVISLTLCPGMWLIYGVMLDWGTSLDTVVGTLSSQQGWGIGVTLRLPVLILGHLKHKGSPGVVASVWIR